MPSWLSDQRVWNHAPKSRYNSSMTEIECQFQNPTTLSPGVYAARVTQYPEQKEIELAGQLSQRFAVTVIFLPTRGIARVKNPDILLGDVFAEMKCITGNVKAVGKRFRDATKQAQHIVLRIENPAITLKEVWTTIKGEVECMKKKGTWKIRMPLELILLIDGEFHMWDLQKL